MPITFQPLNFEQANPLLAGLMQGQQFGQNFQKFPAELQKLQSQAALEEFKRMFEEKKAPLYPDFIQAELLKAQAEPREINARAGLYGAQTGQASAETDKIRYLLEHPGYMAGDEGKTIQYLMDRGLLNKNGLNGNVQHPGGSTTITPQTQGQENQPPIINASPMNNNQNFSNIEPFKTGNPLADSILNRKYALSAYQQQMAKGYNWGHMTAETKNLLTAQGLGMGVDPVKMSQYINQGMDIRKIAQAEGLDPDNIPPPIYPPTATTKTRVQQVEQVSAELNYLESATSAAIAPYANTFAGYSPERIKDMLSNNVEAQKRFGRYVGALSIQTGLATGRALLEGTNRPGVEIMREVKNSALKGIDQHSPVKMSKVSFEESQKFINEKLHAGAKIRTVTGMNPFSTKKETGNSTVTKQWKIINGKMTPVEEK